MHGDKMTSAHAILVFIGFSAEELHYPLAQCGSCTLSALQIPWQQHCPGIVIVQAGIVAFIAATLFLRTWLHPDSIQSGQLYSGFLFFSLLQMFFSGIAEMTFAVSLFCFCQCQTLPACMCICIWDVLDKSSALSCYCYAIGYTMLCHATWSPAMQPPNCISYFACFHHANP